MTIFIASIFLPYTVSYESHDQSIPRVAPEANPASLPRSESWSSVLSDAAPPTDSSILKTPGATTNLETIFVPEDTFDVPPPHLLTNKLPSRRKAPVHRPNSLEVENWGKNRILNQPESRARAAPSASILQHDPPSRPLQSPEPVMRQQRRRTASTRLSDSHFVDKTYNIVPSSIGNSDLIAALNAASKGGLLTDKTWIGTLGMPTNALGDKAKSDIASDMELDFESLTVWVDDDDFTGHYEHYCKTILWPHLHYQIPDHPKSKAYEDHSWNFYVKVNQSFADCIVKNWKRGDVVWIQDYHLMLVPGMVRAKLPDAAIGFFMHGAFPSSEIFRCLATRKDLIQGLLGANLLGFQIKEYVRHFLQSCSRLLNVETTKTGVILEDGRFIHVSAFPVGIDDEALGSSRQADEVKDWIGQISERYKGKRLVIARDKLDKIHGVRHKLLAYERLLQQYPEFRRDVVLIQIATSAQEDPELEREISNIVQRINTAFSNLTHQAIVFLRQDIDHHQWLALVMLSDCLMITSLREGMNLRGHEYIHCQDGMLASAKHGPLILSESTGAAKVLGSNALLVNPYDTKQCMLALKEALEMNADEKALRWQSLHDIVLTKGALQWYEAYHKALNHAHREHSVRDATSVPRLSVDAFKKIYAAASKRLLILDYEGTLASSELHEETVSNDTSQCLGILDDLIRDETNIVWVMSGRATQELEKIFKDADGLGLIAENGAYTRAAGAFEWTALCDMSHIDQWKEGLRQALDYYQSRIVGSTLEEFETSFILRYDQVEDVDAAFTKCGDFANHINDLSRDQRVHAVPIDKGLCVTGIDVNKSSACELIYKQLSERDDADTLPDFLLVIGDSREDEYVFEWAHKMRARGIRQVMTITVGSRNTTAQATITQGVAGVLSALQKMIQS